MSSKAFMKVDIANHDGVEVIFEEIKPDKINHLAVKSHVDRSITPSVPYQFPEKYISNVADNPVHNLCYAGDMAKII